MEKKNKAILLLLLMGSLCVNNILAKKPKNIFWEGVGIAAAVVAAGVGACKLVQWYFTETNSQLVERAEREYNDALQFADDIVLFEEAYNISNYITPREQKLVFDVLQEPVLYSLALIPFNKGLSAYSYVNNVAHVNNKLDATLKQLHIRINESKNKYLDYNDAQAIRSMHILVPKIEKYIPHLSLLSNYLVHHKKYFNLFDMESYCIKKYDTQLRIIGSGTTQYVMANDIRQSVVWNYGNKKYPFITFIFEIESDISSLKSNIRYLSYHYAERMHYAHKLLDSLEWIRNVVITDDRYTYEKYQAEQERLERLRIEALQEQTRIERAQLYAQREHNRLLAQNNRLKAQQIEQQINENNNVSCNITFIVD